MCTSLDDRNFIYLDTTGSRPRKYYSDLGGLNT